ncbi:MAG: hypothetical protein AUJ52_01135 [Elusimicrobia bacterium CG1_02_63_36]|nr:MAG: hypothetical protein AUJ52_01135 [Elusimicrobia bacterium CG1_02_63_36]
MEPPIRVQFSTFKEDRKQILVASIPPCPREKRPCYYKPKGLSAGSLVRVGDADRRMTEYEIASCIAERGQPEEDKRPVQDVSRESLNRILIQEYFDEVRKRRPRAAHLNLPIDELRKIYRIDVSKDGELVPSLAGFMMFNDYPQADFPSLCITVVRYSGLMRSESSGGADILDNQKVEGPIPVMLSEALAAIERNMRRRTLKTGLLSENLSEYPELAVREVLVNAVAHRDYSPGALGSQIQVKMYSDGIVIQSPGGLHGPVTVDSLDEVGIHSTRNVQLMRLFEERGIGENRGSGIRTIILQLIGAHLPPPLFEDGGTYFRVTFSNESLLNEKTVDWLNRFAGFPINDRQRLALAFLKRNERITNKEYSRLTQCDSRRATAELGELRDSGILNQKGSRRWAIYEISPFGLQGTLPPAAQKLKRFPKMVYSIIQNDGPIRALTIAEECGISKAYVKLIVRDLLKSKLIETMEKNPRSPKQAYRVKSFHKTERRSGEN